MKNNKGISLITLLITVVVIIIIVSIVSYNGVNMVKDTRKKDAEDRLKIICNAIIKDDTFLNISGDEEVLLNESDFDYMDLLKYYDANDEIKVVKNISDINDVRNVSYTLIMKDIETSEEYSYTFDYNLHTDKYSYSVSFNESKGVNRPIVVNGMTALMPDGKTEVKDIYKDNWYNYGKGRANFAKMKYQDKIYVWVPRFAYDIQNFYEGRAASNVPSTAISIVFLRETSSYMQNDEVMEGEYRVHPAFRKDGIEYSGIWIEQNTLNAKGSLPTSPLHETFDVDADLHMMTNMECGAALYLMHALDVMGEITFEKDEYVAASADGLGIFSGSDGFVTPYLVNASGDVELSGTYGDAFYETPWDRVIANYPTKDKKYVIRKFDSSIFDFTNSNGSDSATYRGVIVIK